MSSANYRYACICVLALVIGCGRQTSLSKDDMKKMSGGEIKKVVPVSGKVLVDGEPKKGVYIQFHSSVGTAVAEAVTDAEGKYCCSKYANCDGIEPGEYRLGFRYMPKVNPAGKGKDLLDDKYSNPLKSDKKLIVKDGEPQKDANFELSTTGK